MEIAFFDTYPGSDAANFNGLWNVYPYFARGTILGSDMERGLFVWRMGDSTAVTPIAPSAPHDVRKNRYVSFVPTDEIGAEFLNQALRVELTEGPGSAGVVGWVDVPFDPSCQNGSTR